MYFTPKKYQPETEFRRYVDIIKDLIDEITWDRRPNSPKVI